MFLLTSGLSDMKRISFEDSLTLARKSLLNNELDKKEGEDTKSLPQPKIEFMNLNNEKVKDINKTLFQNNNIKQVRVKTENTISYLA